MSAKEMFKKLGYEYIEYIGRIAYYKKVGNYDIEIDFWVDSGDYTIENKYILSYEELQAINKQVEELGWNK